MPRRKTKDSRMKRRSKVRVLVRKKSRFLEGVKSIDISDIDFLRRFVTEHGKIVPARMTGATARQQRQIQQGVRRARTMGLLP